MPVLLSATTTIPDMVTSGLGVLTSSFTFLMSNPLAQVILGITLGIIGFRAFASMRRAAGGNG